MSKLNIGDKAPEFSTTNQNGKEMDLKTFKGKKLVLYFYPKDNTPTCTTESCNLRDNYQRFINNGFEVVGVSPDGEKSHQKFIKKYELPFDLLADTDHSISEAFGVWQEKSMFGKKYMGIARTTFVLDEKGNITDIIEKVKAKEHTEQILTT